MRGLRQVSLLPPQLGCIAGLQSASSSVGHGDRINLLKLGVALEFTSFLKGENIHETNSLFA